MNNNPKKPLTITFTGIFNFAQDEMEQLIQQFLVASRRAEIPPQARVNCATAGFTTANGYTVLAWETQQCE